MNLPEFAVRRPITIFMLFLTVVIFGALALARLPVDLMPSFEWFSRSSCLHAARKVFK